MSIAILTCSEDERGNLPVAHERVKKLVQSLTDFGAQNIFIFDDGVGYASKGAKNAFIKLTEQYSCHYFKSESRLGVCGNYNFAVKTILSKYPEEKWVALLSDDQVLLGPANLYIEYFLHNNDCSKIGMVGYISLFAEDLIRNQILQHKKEMYTTNKVMTFFKSLNMPEIKTYDTIEELLRLFPGWAWDKPSLRGHCTGSAFVIRTDLWEKFGGFFESIYQPDEDYGDNVWNLTDCICVQIPTYPLIHYGGGSSWGQYSQSDIYKNCTKNWEKRPHGVGEDWSVRGRKAATIIGQRANLLHNFVYLPLSFS